jgi:RNA polymerase sigma-70 factor (ECF subfamily)
MGSSKTSECSVIGELCRSASAPAMGESFDEVVLPHLDAAYRLACWLMRNKHDAEDALQEALLRAFRYFRTYTGGNGRAWFLRIVRNACRGWRGRSLQAPSDPFDEERHSDARPACDPETLALQAEDVRLIEQAMSSLPTRSRELLVLRELEGLSYRELAAVQGIPIGTVMSSLSRAREAFRRAMDSQLKQYGIPERRHPHEHEADAVGVNRLETKRRGE